MDRFRSEPTPKWVRARVGGTFVADSRRARIVWAGKVARTYAMPRGDVRAHTGEPQEARDVVLYGRVRPVDLVVDGRRVEQGAFLPPEDDPALEDHLLLRWRAMDAWYEEDQEVFVHPHDPHHRIDIRQSTRHVVVEVDGERVAQSRRPTLLFETGLPVRYYLPQTDVRLDLLRESDKRTGCAYKGFARYRHLVTGGRRHEDLVWTYPAPFPEGQSIRGLLCFYNERVDLRVDGELQERLQVVALDDGDL